MPVWKMQERKGLYLNRGKREREKKTFTRQLIFTKQEESTKQSVIVFLGCHTITVSETLSFQARKSCSFSLRHEVLLLTCHSSACVLTEKGQKDSSFPGFFHMKFSRVLLREVTSRWWKSKYSSMNLPFWRCDTKSPTPSVRERVCVCVYRS